MHRQRLIGPACLAGALIVAGLHPASAAALSVGSLDTSFGDNGIVLTAVSGADDGANAVAVTPGGKIVAAGWSGSPTGYRIGLARYNPNGSLDTTFSGDGKQTTAIGTGGLAAAVALQPDGKIVVAGNADVGSVTRFALARYNPNGTLDTTFSGDGKQTTAIGAKAQAFAVKIQPDGKIVVAGNAQVGSVWQIALARYNPNGSLDTTFSGDGKQTTAIGSTSGASAIALQGDGKIVVAGLSFTGSNDYFALARYNPNGKLDATFSGDGKQTTKIASGSRAFDVALQPDGKIVAAGDAYTATQDLFALARYNPNGSLDTTFSGDGKQTTGFGGAATARSLARQRNGKLVLAGDATVGGDTDFALARYNPNGTLDTSFSGDGKLTTPVSSTTDQADAVALQRDGKIVAAGVAGHGSQRLFALTRYIGDSTAAKNR